MKKIIISLVVLASLAMITDSYAAGELTGKFKRGYTDNDAFDQYVDIIGTADIQVDHFIAPAAASASACTTSVSDTLNFSGDTSGVTQPGTPRALYFVLPQDCTGIVKIVGLDPQGDTVTEYRHNDPADFAGNWEDTGSYALIKIISISGNSTLNGNLATADSYIIGTSDKFGMTYAPQSDTVIKCTAAGVDEETTDALVETDTGIGTWNPVDFSDGSISFSIRYRKNWYSD